MVILLVTEHIQASRCRSDSDGTATGRKKIFSSKCSSALEVRDNGLVWAWWLERHDNSKNLKFGDEISREKRRELEGLAGPFSSIFGGRSGSATVDAQSIELTSSNLYNNTHI
ncbi:hypothetical protein PoB_002209500 [Plakobranchus ocellatus]|uniref:Uncharacterized protein n=1 Tax=Plakobranchus ocellatus TaxID=259542 RepID=A0AAV3ZM12_9GAST|nr:hypothetical protein PoB_002209500 [Plakobranchus ocellatus]